MSWTPRQRAMLQQMGIRLWSPATPVTPAAEVEVTGSAGSTAGPAAPVGSTPAPHPGERSDGVARMDWSALRAAVASCTACGLCKSRTNTVFGVGNVRARWMIVGEAPGEQEDRRGEPFVGKSGQLLDSMLRALGLTRNEDDASRQVYIANTLKCRPPGNRNPEPGELAQCEPFLVRQIELIQPALILAMGRFAVQAMLRSNEPVGRLRGRVHRYHGVPLVVSYHPAYLLRNPQDKARAWSDLCIALDAARRVEGP